MVDPDCGARCAIRDTRATGEERYYWTVTAIGAPDPVAAERTGDPAQARARSRLLLPERSRLRQAGTPLHNGGRSEHDETATPRRFACGG
jgi:hypothetical protein